MTHAINPPQKSPKINNGIRIGEYKIYFKIIVKIFISRFKIKDRIFTTGIRALGLLDTNKCIG